MGSVLAFDILCVAQPELSPQLEDKKKYASDTDLNELPESKDVTDFSGRLTCTCGVILFMNHHDNIDHKFA